MRKTSQQEIESVIRLDGTARFKHFVKRVVDSEEAWGLWSNGWATMSDDDGNQVFPLWPAREYAERCRLGELANYEASQIALVDLLDDLIPKLAAKSMLPGVFPTPSGQGAVVSLRDLEGALRTEMEKY